MSREISAPNKASMVGNPPQTLPAEFRGDVTLSQQNKTTPTTDCKSARACLDTGNYNHSPELSPPQRLNNAPMASSALTSSEKRADRRAEAPKLKTDGAAVCPTPQWSSGVKVSREDPVSPCHSSVTSNNKSHTQAQSAQSASPAFQCSVFKQAQPVAFLPSTDVSSSLCKITLPPALGQIAKLREATANQFQKESQPQSSGVGGTPLVQTFPYPFPVGRTPAAEKKSASKLKSNYSSIKMAKSVGEHKSLASVVASPAIVLPLQHPALTSAAPTRYTLSPTAAICCGSALASITSQSRLLNHVEKGVILDKTPISSLKAMPPSASEDHRVACSIEQRDVPLDLSAKSKRPKCINDQSPVSTAETNTESNQRDFTTTKRTHSSTYSSAVQYPVLPNTHRNGSHQKQLNRPQNHQTTEPKPSWGKGSSQDPIKNIPGTYVGVASPILASTLRGKDGKETFADEFQSFAKQELISIIDQGEHLASGGKKPSCLMKGNQHSHTVKHVKNTSTTKNCPPKGALMTVLSGSASTQQKSATGNTAVSPAWQQPPQFPHQASSAQKKNSPGSPKTRALQGEDQSPSQPVDEKWERICPLSNLASIVKQQGPAGNGNGQALPVASRKADIVNLVTGNQDAQSKPTSASEYPAYWSAEKWPSVPSLGDSSQATKRLEKPSNASETLENNTKKHPGQGEHKGRQATLGSSNATGHSLMFGSNASTNGNRMESQLAQVLEGEMLKKESGASDCPPSEKLDGLVASILSGQSPGVGDKFERKTNGTKEESPAKVKAAATKQKRPSPKKPAKEKSPADPLKKAAGKKKADTDSSPTKVSSQKKVKCVDSLCVLMTCSCRPSCPSVHP